MGRPPLPVGTAGEIRVYPVRDGFRARCLVRDHNGRIREVERSGSSETKAKARLREAVRDRGRVEADAEITGETKLSEVVRIWLVDLRAEVAAGEKSPEKSPGWPTTAPGRLNTPRQC
jgi:MoxR-like ATPase